jgi:hypothetical protein
LESLVVTRQLNQIKKTGGGKCLMDLDKEEVLVVVLVAAWGLALEVAHLPGPM